MKVKLAKDVVLGCKTCNQPMKNIEYSYSSYYSFVCVNYQCPEKGIQIHGRWDEFLKG